MLRLWMLTPDRDKPIPTSLSPFDWDDELRFSLIYFMINEHPTYNFFLTEETTDVF